jgi:DtxR family Mn-dependent transcriptional regulator
VSTLNISDSLTRKEAEHLVFIYRKQIEDRDRATTTIVAKEFHVSAAVVTESFQKLAKKKLVEYTPYYGIKLTLKGVAKAQKLLRKHRLLETLFVNLMRFNPKEACREASTIGYYCSEALINRICSTYNHPTQCPCNKQIHADPYCKGDKNSDLC